MDDFGVKYVDKEHTNQLMAVLIKSYKISSKWEGRSYLGLELDWGYENREMHLSMIAYIVDALKRFDHKQPWLHITG